MAKANIIPELDEEESVSQGSGNEELVGDEIGAHIGVSIEGDSSSHSNVPEGCENDGVELDITLETQGRKRKSTPSKPDGSSSSRKRSKVTPGYEDSTGDEDNDDEEDDK